MKKTLILMFTSIIFLYNNAISQDYGYVVSKTLFNQESIDNVGWPTISENRIITNPKTANGYFINCFEGTHTIFKGMPRIPDGDVIQLLATMEFQEGSGHFGMGFRTDDRKVYVFEINPQTNAFNFFYHNESGGSNTILLNGRLSGDLRGRFSIDFKIEKDRISVAQSNSNLGYTNHSLGGKITDAGFIVGGRTAFRAFSFLFHNPDRKPKERYIRDPYYIDFSKDGNIITFDKNGLVAWNIETGDKINTIHDKMEIAWLTDKISFPKLNLIAEQRDERSNSGKVKSLEIRIVNVLTGELLLKNIVSAKDEGKIYAGENNKKLFHFIPGNSIVYIYDIESPKLLASKKIKLKKTQEIVGFLNENYVIIKDSKDYFAPKTIYLVDMNTGNKLYSMKDTYNRFYFITGDYNHYFASVIKDYKNQLLKINSQTGEIISQAPVGENYINGCLTNDNQYLVLWQCASLRSCEDYLEVIDIQNLKTLYIKKAFDYEEQISFLKVDPENQYMLVVGRYSQKAKLFNFATGEFLYEIGD